MKKIKLFPVLVILIFSLSLISVSAETAQNIWRRAYECNHPDMGCQTEIICLNDECSNIQENAIRAARQNQGLDANPFQGQNNRNVDTNVGGGFESPPPDSFTNSQTSQENTGEDLSDDPFESERDAGAEIPEEGIWDNDQEGQLRQGNQVTLGGNTYDVTETVELSGNGRSYSYRVINNNNQKYYLANDGNLYNSQGQLVDPNNDFQGVTDADGKPEYSVLVNSENPTDNNPFTLNSQGITDEVDLGAIEPGAEDGETPEDEEGSGQKGPEETEEEVHHSLSNTQLSGDVSAGTSNLEFSGDEIITAEDGTTKTGDSRSFNYNSDGVLCGDASSSDGAVDDCGYQYYASDGESSSRVCNDEGTCWSTPDLNGYEDLEQARRDRVSQECIFKDDVSCPGIDNQATIEAAQLRIFGQNMKNYFLGLWQRFIGNPFTAAILTACGVDNYMGDLISDPRLDPEVATPYPGSIGGLLSSLEGDDDHRQFSGHPISLSTNDGTLIFPGNIRDNLLGFDVLIQSSVAQVLEDHPENRPEQNGFYRYEYTYRMIGQVDAYEMRLVRSCGDLPSIEDSPSSDQLNFESQSSSMSDPVWEYNGKTFNCEEEECIFDSICMFFGTQIPQNQVSAGLVNRLTQTGSRANSPMINYGGSLNNGRIQIICFPLVYEGSEEELTNYQEKLTQLCE